MTSKLIKRVKSLLFVYLISITICACASVPENNITSEGASEENTIAEESVVEATAIPTHKLYFDVSVNIPEDIYSEHDIKIFLDGNEYHSFTTSEYYTELSDVEEGTHSLSFFYDDNQLSGNEYSFDLTKESSICFSIDYQEDLIISPIEIKDTIADSAISYPDVVGLSLIDALNKLDSLHFVNIIYNSNNDSNILDTSDWEIESQNIKPGDLIDKAARIELTCKKVFHQLYFDLSFDQNLFLATYDIDVYLDGNMIDTIPHGKSFTYLTKVKEGNHEVIFYKNTNHDVKSSKNLNISTDSTLIGRLHSNNNDIELNDFIVKDTIDNTSFEIVNVTGMPLDKALSTLGSIGFINLSEEPSGEIWSRSNWVVISQSVNAGEVKDKNTPITLSCMKKTDYLSKYYLKLTIPDAINRSEEMNNTIRFVDYLQNAYMDNKVSNMSSVEQQKWIVKQASYEDEFIKLSFIYTGNIEMPDLISKNLDVAFKTMTDKGFSSVEAIADDGSIIWDNSKWKVIKQSIEAGSPVNANGKITLTVTSNVTSTSTSSSDNKPKSEDKTTSTNNSSAEKSSDDKGLFYTTNDKSTYKNGNSGVYAYRRNGKNYDLYIIIDFDEGAVYDFMDGNGDITCTKGYIKSGDLNSVLIVTYYDGADSWESGYCFAWKNQPDHLKYQIDASDSTQFDYYATSLKSALKIKDTKTIITD
ncbi:PASTA domain-containing protein (plasmid) [Butyrivibrio proteoclasticus B316]|uniref:PASTA domain-containing protein n=1 Tax=Butyrivibrio proteoclasticus (strain ATCC 51982 / DSM 14932 / B316) TaxID=515622 RepID=E0S4Y7_BUTPB|nr:PASTA domain-containing protein [Butyrivibrio proteoclasticus]ADL36469.1 PASTA domain-containing protein [Butyrivibrio proteoclasticus B316]